MKSMKTILILSGFWLLTCASIYSQTGQTNTYGPSISWMNSSNYHLYLNQRRVALHDEFVGVWSGVLTSNDWATFHSHWTPGTLADGSALTNLQRTNIPGLFGGTNFTSLIIHSNSITTTTNTTWGYGPGLLTWGMDGGTNYLYQSITTNRWGRVALGTNF